MTTETTTAIKPIPYSRKADPIIPVGHPQYVWRPAADTDVQRTWLRYGWKPTVHATTPVAA